MSKRVLPTNVKKDNQSDRYPYFECLHLNSVFKFFSMDVCAPGEKRLAFSNESLSHTSRFFVAELQIFCRGQIGLKSVGTSACRTLADFLSRLTAFRFGDESISAMLEKTLVHVTLMTIPHWLRHTRAPKNCLGPPQTSRQGLKRRIEI